MFAETIMDATKNIQQPYESIPERSGLTYQEFAKEYLYPMRPVVLTDGLKGWDAVGRWSPAFFRDQYPNKQMTIDDRNHNVSDFINWVEKSCDGNVAPYFRNQQVGVVFPELHGDVLPMPPFLLPNWLRGPFYPSAGREAEIYIGGAGGGFPFLHYDSNSTHAFLAQVYGEKEAILYSPEETDLVYPKTGTPFRHHSWITDVETPDFKKFPLFAKATAHRGFLKPGSLLFIPSRWWHTARMLSPSITISYNVANSSNWSNVRDEVCFKGRMKQPLLVPFIFCYMTLLGWGHSLFDLLSSGAVTKK